MPAEEKSGVGVKKNLAGFPRFPQSYLRKTSGLTAVVCKERHEGLLGAVAVGRPAAADGGGR